MMKRFSVCAAALFAVVLISQPAMAAVKLVGSSGNAGSSNPEDPSMAVVDVDDENLYEISTADGTATYIRGIRNDIDDILIAEIGWAGPYWGESYRDGQHIGYNPDNGLLYHRNGTTGYRDAPDPRHYDTRLIETYEPGAAADFLADPVMVANSLLTPFGPSLADPVGRTNASFPIDGALWGEARNLTYNPVDSTFIIANNNGNIGEMDATTGASTFIRTNAITHKGLSWYTDGSDTGRLFSGVNDESPGDLFYELGTDKLLSPATYLAPLDVAASISVSGAPGGAVVDQTLGMTQNPETGDLYAIVALSTGGRHLIRFDKSDIDAFDPAFAFFVDATYVGPTQGNVAGIAFVPVEVGGASSDANGDGWVDGLDYLIWAANFGDDPADDPPGAPGNGDLNDDGVVDGLDYLQWAGDFGTHPASAVPEPGTFALAALALVGMLVSRRRRS